MEHSGASGKPSQGIQSRVLFDLTDISKGRFTRYNFAGMRQAYDKPTTRTVSCKCLRLSCTSQKISWDFKTCF